MFSDKPRAALVLIVLFAFLILGAQAAEPPAKVGDASRKFGFASYQAGDGGGCRC